MGMLDVYIFMLLPPGYEQSIVDTCIYVMLDDLTSIVTEVDEYVDDLMLVARKLSDLTYLKQRLEGTFEMKDLGELEYFLGLKVTRNRLGTEIPTPAIGLCHGDPQTIRDDRLLSHQYTSRTRH